MEYFYQLILLGAYNNVQKASLQKSLDECLDAIGIDKKLLKIIEHTKDYQRAMPAYCIYFASSQKDERLARALFGQGISVLPVVENAKAASKINDSEIQKINAGFLCEGYAKISATILAGLGLTRALRKVFISYKRDESQNIATQLYEQLGAAGFTVFLDTHCIEKGVNFQENLMHQMVDCDIIVLLNTPHFFDSFWTMEEFQQANTMHIGIVQVLWPSVNQRDDCSLTTSIQLKCDSFDFCGRKCSSFLKESAINNIIECIEKMRMRSYNARKMFIIDNLTKAYQAKGKNLYAFANGCLFDPQKDEVLIPEIAYPKSETFISAKENKAKKRTIIYSDINVKKTWKDYLKWLNKSLPIKTISVQEKIK